MPTESLNIEYLRKRAALPWSVGKYRSLIAKRKLELLEKAGYKCQNCGAKENLTVDHVKPYRDLRKQFKTTRFSRLSLQYCQILCVNCHNKKNKDENSKNEGESSGL